MISYVHIYISISLSLYVGIYIHIHLEVDVHPQVWIISASARSWLDARPRTTAAGRLGAPFPSIRLKGKLW
jgi:hypothetical protein